MANLLHSVSALAGGLAKTAGKAPVKDVRACLDAAAALVRRAEAGRAVYGFFGGGLTDIIDNVLQIATPLVSISGDFELSNLLGSLKVWLDKKKIEEQMADAQRNAMMNQSYEDLYSYGY